MEKKFKDDELVSMREVAAALGLNYNTLKKYKWEGKFPDFPEPDKTYGNSYAWWGRTINEWLASQPKIMVTVAVTVLPGGVEAWAAERGAPADEESVRADMKRYLESLIEDSELVSYNVVVE